MQEFLNDVVIGAGEIVTEFRSTDLRVSEKGKLDFVSNADAATEEFIISKISQQFPDDGIIGEESAFRTSRSGRVWYVDPIDGTHNYLLGIPFWGISIGVVDNGKAVAAGIHCPSLGETLIAT